MAKAILCDICGEKCGSDWRFELIDKLSISDRKKDICRYCLREIQENIINSKKEK